MTSRDAFAFGLFVAAFYLTAAAYVWEATGQQAYAIAAALVAIRLVWEVMRLARR